jgi:folate-binding protein YgfZ
MAVSFRKNRVPVKISGPDAQKLLDDVLTASVEAAPDQVRWWALLSPQGKVQAEGLISFDDAAFWLDVDDEAADAFLKRMRMYKLRATAEIEDLRHSHHVGWSPEPSPDGISNKDPRQPAMGYRVIAHRDQTGDWYESDIDYAERRIAEGICEQGDDFAADTVFPHDIGMDLLGGIDFKKGCYVGQEVVSRMQHRGTARRRPVIVSGVAAKAGATVVCGGRDAGAIGAVAEGKALAILRLDRITDPAGATIEGQGVQLALPLWASYGFGDSGSSDDT